MRGRIRLNESSSSRTAGRLAEVNCGGAVRSVESNPIEDESVVEATRSIPVGVPSKCSDEVQEMVARATPVRSEARTIAGPAKVISKVQSQTACRDDAGRRDRRRSNPIAISTTSVIWTRT